MKLNESYTYDDIENYEYGPFGELVSKSGSYADENTYRFSTKPIDVETGHYYYGYRYYSTNLGRWISRDPIGEVGAAKWFDHQKLLRQYRQLEAKVPKYDWFIGLLVPKFYPSELKGYNLLGFVNNNSVDTFDYLGLVVMIRSRSVSGTRGVGSHTFVAVRKNGKTTTYSGIKDDNGNLGVRKDYPADEKAKESVVVPPPAGMTQEEWDDAVIQAGEDALKLDGQRDYKLFGGDGGKTSGNCHSTTSDIIENAGGSVPSGFDPVGANPGLR